MNLYPYNPNMNQLIQTNVDGVEVDRAFIAHFQVAEADATVADIDGIHAAKACPVVSTAAAGVVKAATAITDTLTITSTIALGTASNDLKILLTTAADDVLAVTKTDGTKTINIALAKTTAGNNTAANIQVAVRALTTVGGINVSAVVCSAGGNWNTAAVATGEVAAVSFAGGTTAIDVITTNITQPSVPRNITATTDGTAADIKPVQVTITGTNYNDEVITEVLPVFTENNKTTVAGTKAFKTVTGVSIPAHDGLAATTSIGFGEVLGLPYLLPYNTVLSTFFDNAAASGAPTVTTSLTAIESNTLDMHNALNSKVVDVYLMV
jgi:hypothetical protein